MPAIFFFAAEHLYGVLVTSNSDSQLIHVIFEEGYRFYRRNIDEDEEKS